MRDHPLPAVIYLHGGSGAGTDNIRQISGYNCKGTHLWTSPAMRKKHPAFVIVPQLPGGNQWGAADSLEPAPYAGLALELLAALSREFRIDPDRVYLVGHSRGGRGVWDLAAKRPDLFAAAVPVCGDGNVDRIIKARRIPIWAFHGDRDAVIPVAGSRKLVAVLRAVGTPVRYTEYPNAGHDVWDLAFAEPDLPAWLFAQSRK